MYGRKKTWQWWNKAHHLDSSVVRCLKYINWVCTSTGYMHTKLEFVTSLVVQEELAHLVNA